MIIYLSGPITGVPDYMERFARAEQRLRMKGAFPVVNPAAVFEPFAKTNATTGDFLTACLRLMEHCDSIIMLRGWEHSKGALMELGKAAELGMSAHIEVANGGMVVYEYVKNGAKKLLEDWQTKRGE